MTAQLSPAPVQRFWDNLGFPAFNGQLFTYAAGTSTPQTTYVDSTQTTTNTNPIVLNPRGECNLWLDPTLSYKFVLFDFFGTLIFSVDNILGSLNPTSNIVPSIDNNFTLGSPTFAWKNLYLGPNHAPVLDTVSGNIGYYARTLAEIAASVTPTNYAYGPDHIGDDVRRYGTIDLTGATDCRAILNTANSVGVALYFPKGTYKISSNLTLSVPCIFEFGAILKPDASVVITIAGAIVAGPWQIFDVTNTSATGSLTSNTSLQTGFTPISGVCPIDKCYAEWFGAKGNNSGFNDGAPIQAACNFAMSCYGIAVQLQAKIYYTTQTIYVGGSAYQLGTGTGGQGPCAANLYGVSGLLNGVGGTRGTLITDHGAFTTVGQPILRCRTIPSYDQHNEIRDISLDSTSATYAVGLEWGGTCYSRAVNCRFGATGLLEGIRFNNTLDSGANFTEFCIAEKCEFFAGCATIGHFIADTSDVSYHGCGWESRCVINGNTSSNPVILIDDNAQWYNGVLDAQIFGGPFTLIQNNNHALTNLSASGRVTLECGTATIVLGAGSNATPYFFFTGDIRSNGPNVTAGTFLRCHSFVNGNTGSVGPVGAECGFTKAMTTGANTLTSHPTLANAPRDVYVIFSGTNYNAMYRLFVQPQAGGAATVVNLYNPTTASTEVFFSNVAGYGHVTFSGDTNGNIIATNAGFPASGVNAFWYERQLYPGNYGGQSCYI